jgi:hypothetical protein
MTGIDAGRGHGASSQAPQNALKKPSEVLLDWNEA